MTAKLFEKWFQKTILLHPTKEGILEAVNITGHDAELLDSKIEIRPTRVYQVRGIKGIKRLCIHDCDTTQLLNLYEKPENPGVMSEKILADLLDISYHKGMKDAGTGGELNKQLAMTLRIIMILSGVAAIIGILMYLQK